MGFYERVFAWLFANNSFDDGKCFDGIILIDLISLRKTYLLILLGNIVLISPKNTLISLITFKSKDINGNTPKIVVLKVKYNIVHAKRKI